MRATHAVHAVPDLRITAGRFPPEFFVGLPRSWDDHDNISDAQKQLMAQL